MTHKERKALMHRAENAHDDVNNVLEALNEYIFELEDQVDETKSYIEDLENKLKEANARIEELEKSE